MSSSTSSLPLPIPASPPAGVVVGRANHRSSDESSPRLEDARDDEEQEAREGREARPLAQQQVETEAGRDRQEPAGDLHDLEGVDDRNPVGGVLDLLDELLPVVLALDRRIAQERPQYDRESREEDRDAGEAF